MANAAVAKTIVVPVLLAGGSGTRLWPMSRESYPKQFLKLVGEWSLLQQTIRRARSLETTVEPVIVCNDAHRFLVAEQIRQLGKSGVSTAQILIEPEGRNTAPAATIACLHAREQHGPDALVFIMAADHLIADAAAFAAAANTAIALAQSERLVTFGIPPRRAETGYGYLKQGPAFQSGGFEVLSFVEKPDTATAEKYVQSGDYFWNSGMFLFRAQTFLDEVQRHEPAMLEACEQAIAAASRDLDFIRLDPKSFKAARADSIDYAVMEKTDKAIMVPLDAGWDDIGSWSFMETLPRDSRGNYGHGHVVLEDCNNTLIHSESRLTAALGLKDITIVETKDAVLVADRNRLQDVKRIVSILKSAGKPEATAHTVVHRPWGSYESIAAGGRFQVKRIVVNPRQKLSLQMHHHRAEHWIVVTGTALVTCGEKKYLLAENESTYIPLGAQHRLENPGSIMLELIEVQSGGYLEEDDIVRFDDVYGRSS